MRCPRCSDEYEPSVRTCAGCGIELVPDDADVAPPMLVDARLGTFHPAIAERLATMLDERGIDHETVTLPDGGVRLVVDREWRDDLRAELTLTWGELVRRLPEDELLEVLASGGTAPGWYDAPQGGHVDREGRLVVAPDEEEQRQDDAARVVGPALLTVGAILVVIGWYVLDSAAVTVAGAGLVLLGLFNPR